LAVIRQGGRVNGGFAQFAKNDPVLWKILQQVHFSDVLRVPKRHKAVRKSIETVWLPKDA